MLYLIYFSHVNVSVGLSVRPSVCLTFFFMYPLSTIGQEYPWIIVDSVIYKILVILAKYEQNLSQI